MKNRGITLIALIITIVVLIILAGVSINLTLGENGIFKRAEEAKQKESESSAREKLELVLVEANIEKETNTNYNKEEFLTEMLENNNITVEGDTVIVDNYIYLIDREKLEIVESLGETLIKLTSEVQEYLGVNENGKYEVSILLTIESDTDLQSILIQNTDGTTFEIIPEGSKVAKDLTAELDETYTIIATTKDGKTGTRKILERSVENIRTLEELVVFRDKVNSGLTYEGKTINLLANIDLSNVCGTGIGNWVPIGSFKGIFDGNYHTISNIYISTTSRDQGLFKTNYGTIRCLSLIGNSISGGYYTGSIVGSNYGVIEKICCDVEILSNSSNAGANGGITGANYGEIRHCFNLGNVTKYGSNVYNVGGIAGANYNNGKIISCYNIGEIKGTYQVGGIAGGNSDNNKTKKVLISDCYNIGKITCTGSKVGSITGCNGIDSTYPGGTVSNSYFLKGTASSGVGTHYGYAKTQTFIKTESELKSLDIISLLGDSFTNDVQNEDGTWKYNDGYPILKWQIGE